MNHRRNESRSSAFPIFALLLCAAICSAGGVLHVYYKNRQISVARETEAVHTRIEQNRFDIRTTEMHMEQLLNRFVIRKQLEDNRSTMRPIAATVVEEIEPAPQIKRTVASAD